MTVLASAQILQRISFIENSLENSKLFRITFGEAVTRGTQFRVESFLFAEARKQGYIIGPSPTPLEVARMPALESQPLVDEPRSGYYEYPVLVFDFASLYPSVIAAYNMCYSTIL